MDDQNTIALNNQQKDQWNSFVDHTQRMGAGPDPSYLPGFKKDNPSSTLTADHIPVAINDVSAIKANPDIPGMTPAYKAGNNLKYPVTSDGKHLDIGDNPSAIPKPDYNDPVSRQKYAQQFVSKYGDVMHGRADTPLRINETMDEATDSAKNLSIKAAKPLGLDPALVYSSAMEEGMAGLFKDKKGLSDYSGNKDYPTPGFHNFGIDDFTDKVPGLIKKGYLPKDFANQFVKHVQINENGRPVNSADFKSPDAGLQAKAALMKDFQDQTDQFAKKSNVSLTPKQRDFMTLVAYNGGGNMQKMMSEYKQKGFLTDDKVDKDPTGHWTTITKHIAPRLQMRDALKKEGLF